MRLENWFEKLIIDLVFMLKF